jgi:hypothetical protein
LSRYGLDPLLYLWEVEARKVDIVIGKVNHRKSWSSMVNQRIYWRQ